MIKKIMLILVFLTAGICVYPSHSGAQYDDGLNLISLDIKGMDIRDVLKLLSQKSGLNIVADKDVKGTVSLYLRDVDIMEALDVLVSTHSLAYEREGTLVKIMSDRKYRELHGSAFLDKEETEIVKLKHADATEVAKSIMQMKGKSGKIIPDERSGTIVLIDTPGNMERMKNTISELDVPLVTKVFSLGYAQAELIRDKTEDMLSEGVGSVRFDERTNKIAVQATPKKMDDIEAIIRAFDEKTREVIIEASIIQVTLTDKFSHGIDWAALATMGDITLEATTNLSTGLTGTSPSTFTVAKEGGSHSTVLSLLKAYGKTNVLSKPMITVADREEARILVGAKEPYVTSEVTTTSGGTYHTTDHVQFVDVGVRLLVTPEINRDGYIKMNIKPEVSNADATKTVELENPDGSTRTIVPYVTTSEAETTVVVKDKTTLIIGGLMKDTLVDHEERVPFLGDMPVLGKLFSSKGQSKEKTELVIFLRPHIIDGDRTTKQAKGYMDRWESMEEEIVVEEPEDIEVDLDFSEILPKRKPLRKKDTGLKPMIGGPSEKTKTAVPGVKAKEQEKPRKTVKKRPAKKWTTLFGPPDTENYDTGTEKYIGSGQSRVTVKKSPGPVGEVISEDSRTAYEEYYLDIREDIMKRAEKQDVGGLKGEVEVRFTLDKKGFIKRGPVVLNKPDLKLVRSAVNAVKETAPFKPFPGVMRMPEAEIYMVVRYE